jgi:hypothetical protein
MVNIFYILTTFVVSAPTPTTPVAPRSTTIKHKCTNTFSTMIEAINNTNKQIFETLDWINLTRDFFLANFHHLATKKRAGKSNKGNFENLKIKFTIS